MENNKTYEECLEERADKHPVVRPIVELQKLLEKNDIPYFFNLDDFLKHADNEDDVDLDWENFHYHIEIGMMVGNGPAAFSEISITLYKEDKTRLEFLDATHLAGNKTATVNDALLFVNLSPEQAFRRVYKFFKR